MSNSHGDVAALLLAGKAEVDSRDNNGRMPLHLAVDKGRKDLVELLLAHGADVNARSSLAVTPLQRAAVAGRKGSAELLLTNELAHFCIGEEATGDRGLRGAPARGTGSPPPTGATGRASARGCASTLMMAEFLGKENGYCKGRGGCMHIADFASGSLGANGIVGGGIPIAVGAALSQRMQGLSSITVCFFGDGATSTGSFHESVNLASVWKLPVLFVCVNNLYAMSTPLRRQANISDLALRGHAYGIKSVQWTATTRWASIVPRGRLANT